MDDPIRVLLVDDEEPFVRNLSRLLMHRGVRTWTALSGAEALDMIANGKRRPHVAVLDVGMPEMDGVALLRELKKRAPEVEAIMLTGQATLEAGVEAIRHGAFDYLMKPCDIDVLVEKILEARAFEDMKQHPVLWPRNRIADVMARPFVHLYTDSPLTAALAVFTRVNGEETYDTAFIQDRAGRVRGFATRKDLVVEANRDRLAPDVDWNELTLLPSLLPDQPLETVMHCSPITAHPEDRLAETAHRMIERRIRTMPVVRGGEMIGIVRLRDILRHIEQEAE